MSYFGKPPGSSSSGRSKARLITIATGAALFGTVVGGASAVGVVMAIVQPPAHDSHADAGSGLGTATSPIATSPIAPAQPQQTQVAPQPEQQASTTQPPSPGATPNATPSASWPDALSARTQHDAASTAAAPAKPDAANDASGVPQNDEHAAQDHQDHAMPASEPTVAERAPWPNPVSPGAKAMKKHAVAVSEEPAPPATPTPAASPTPTSVTADDTSDTPTNKTRNDLKKPRLTQQQQRSRDAMDRSMDRSMEQGDDRGAVAYPPRQRVIVVSPAAPPPSPERDAGIDRDHRDHGNGLFGLFDAFGGQDHWNNDDHWGNDR